MNTSGFSKPKLQIKKIQSGFTLIELMVTVAIVGILAAIAYPSYAQYIQSARRADAQGDLLRIMDQQEIWFNANRTYTADITQIAVTATRQHYTYALAACAGSTVASCLTATATARAGTSQIHDADCQSLSVSTTGARASVDSGGSDSTAVCWDN